MRYSEMSAEQLKAELASLRAAFEDFKGRGLKLNMARGKPSPEQLDLTMGIMDTLGANDILLDADGEDCRNYGQLRGIPEARSLFGELLGVPAANVIAGGNSSLTMMFDSVARSVSFGVRGSEPWCRQEGCKFLCPSPGYDRHFAVTEAFGIINQPVAMLADGPDMDEIERLVNSDASVKGVWCVPKYSNPQGITYSDAVVRRFAALRPAAPDFRIYWDNAYAVHDLYPGHGDSLLNIKEACDAAGSPDIWLMFASTSKVSFAGGGVAALASSEANLAEVEQIMSLQTIGPDKVNQLRHVRWAEALGGGKGQAAAGVHVQMARLAGILAPKFAVVLETLERELAGLEIATWASPQGGYFISVEAMPQTAKRAVQLAKEAGVSLTPAGATWPYKNDPADSSIRIAPSYPGLEELGLASELLCLCLRIAAAERLLAG